MKEEKNDDELVFMSQQDFCRKTTETKYQIQHTDNRKTTLGYREHLRLDHLQSRRMVKSNIYEATRM